ncbi:MAG: high frequency lysogenization protein HflD [Pseudomonadota bacterium]
MDRTAEQTLALAGIAQSAFLVHQLAHHGLAAHDKFSTVLNSLFVTHPKKTEDVYGGTGKLQLGLKVLQELLDGSSSIFSHAEVLRYQMSLLFLEFKLSRKPHLLTDISTGLDKIKAMYPDADLAEHPMAIRDISRLYLNTLSTLSFRIKVRGDMNHLKNEHIACKVRAALLGGIRSAVLWRQVGGKRWHLLFKRKQIAKTIEQLLGRNRS